MLANWGYQDGSGKYFITIDTDKCNGCAKCVVVCPQVVLEVGEDPADPMRDEPVVFVTKVQAQKLKYSCSPCKTYLTHREKGGTGGENLTELQKGLPCIAACDREAIFHSW